MGQWVIRSVDSYRLEDLKNLPSRARMCDARVPRDGRTSRTRGGPAVPGVAGGLPTGRSTGTACRPRKWPCQEVPRPSGSHPSRLPPGSKCSGSGWRGPLLSGDPPVFRIQSERRSRAVSRGWLSIPPGEGVTAAITGWRPAPCGGRPPITDWLGRVELGYGRHR